ncbi:hypothetical protein F4678DRAFT_463472 [Xylaria arbuscula]|nr:hypothetical protein F4678DRAFT_463472 [Xylaria arbuscula]
MATPFEREFETPQPHTSTELVTFKSPDGKEVVLHARPLAHESLYFHTALNSSFQEATTRVFDLQEHCSDVVLEGFVTWVYLRSSGAAYSVTTLPFLDELCHQGLVRAWLFGDYIGAPAFQDDLMQLMVGYDAELLYPGHDGGFQHCVPEDSPLERYFVDRLCSLIFRIDNEEWSDEIIDWATPDVAIKVCKKLSRKIWNYSGEEEDDIRYFAVHPFTKYKVEE